MTDDTNDIPVKRPMSTRGGQIELALHAAGACTIMLEEDGARVLCDALIEWLG